MTCRRTRFLVTVLALLLAGCSDPESEIAKTDYGEAANFACAAGGKPGAAGAVDGERTEQGARYNLRTPANYDPRIAHPLIIVYAPLHSSAAGNEWFTRLTKVATAAGFIVAYAESRLLYIPSTIDIGTIPARVAAKWCIDTERIYLTGQWQGGSVATALAVLEDTRGVAAAIAPSGAGFTGKDMEGFSCPDPLPVMVMHGKDDELYPGFGPPAAKWWASCNRCEAEPQTLADGCVVYPNCAKGVVTLYCESSGEHVRWFDRNSRVVEFFSSLARRNPTPRPQTPLR